MSRVLVISDLHLPAAHPKALDFVRYVRQKWKTNETVFIGDVVDFHALSFHDPDPDGMSPGDELREAVRQIKPWKKAFPKAKVTIGNHDDRPFRAAMKYGIPRELMREYAEIFQTPGWEWAFQHVIDGVQYIHGTGTTGKYAALNRAIQTRLSTVMGHTHTYPGVQYHSNTENYIFGLNVGALIDIKAYQMAYGKHFVTRPMLGCGVVIDGTDGHFIPMDATNRFNRDA